MLIRYKKNLEKIAMGLLSFMPEQKDVKKLQETINNYEKSSNWHLYLWREDDILGAIGIRLDEANAVIQHITVNPSHRNQGIGRKMVNEIKKMYADQYRLCADEQTKQFFQKCDQSEDTTENLEN
ncbi:MAG TPA: GNAT family N-acetyltransferase [Virgibacillus sp.]|nr:GNAT family N-acetyltransferase [Virgibacillus sp.]